MKLKYEEPRVMRKLHEIRVKHYEETKNMTDEEYINHLNDEGLKVMKKNNMKLKIFEKHQKITVQNKECLPRGNIGPSNPGGSKCNP